ncbi:hypothetical protein OPV22_002374 [Ensete ventricosum]|uniref:Uncharacterized protein n=1 Tax=Ensete ventricosum TaxID=4639 RepID=A0AAV8RXS5_ENSVE|nr:hypothetical protein OPV22_002374 [Ensete ventricosum]
MALVGEIGEEESGSSVCSHWFLQRRLQGEISPYLNCLLRDVDGRRHRPCCTGAGVPCLGEPCTRQKEHHYGQQIERMGSRKKNQCTKYTKLLNMEACPPLPA